MECVLLTGQQRMDEVDEVKALMTRVICSIEYKILGQLRAAITYL